MEAVLGLVGTVLTLAAISWWVSSILNTVKYAIDQNKVVAPTPEDISALQEIYDKAYEQEPPITFDAVMAAMNDIVDEADI